MLAGDSLTRQPASEAGFLKVNSVLIAVGRGGRRDIRPCRIRQWLCRPATCCADAEPADFAKCDCLAEWLRLPAGANLSPESAWRQKKRVAKPPSIETSLCFRILSGAHAFWQLERNTLRRRKVGRDFSGQTVQEGLNILDVGFLECLTELDLRHHVNRTVKIGY